MQESMNSDTTNTPAESKPKQHPFRRAVLRGLALIMPPLLTIVVFLWAWHIIEDYVLTPIESLAKEGIVLYYADTRDDIPSDVRPSDVMVTRGDADEEVPFTALLDGRKPTNDLERQARALGATAVSFTYQDIEYHRVPGGNQWIPADVYELVEENPGSQVPQTAEAFYHRFAELKFPTRAEVIPVFLCVFILVLYLLGKFLAAGVGRIMWNAGESIVHRLPIIRNVYSSVKQISDFVLSERDIQFNRIVAVEYPRKGIWSIGFVTGEGMKSVQDRVGEKVLAVLMPTSPMPATGFTIMVRKSETIELDISMDQAIQFIVSCGVVTPLNQQQHPVAQNVAAAIAQAASPLEDNALSSS